ncbi:MAG: glycosyltransferase family 2 protein [Cyclobacteriaceae bacterium]
MEKIAILIPVHNGIEFTRKCIPDLLKQTDDLKEKAIFIPVIIDDGSTDGTSEWLSEKYPELHILKGDGSLWWSGSINAGIKHVMDNNLADYILWWNNDIKPDDSYFKELVQILPGLSNTMVAGSKIYDEQSGKIWGMGGKFDFKTGKKYQVAYYVDDSDAYDKVVDVDWLPGMGTLAHVDIYKKTGLIDAVTFPQYHGDLEWTFKAKLSGYKVQVFPSLKIFNDTSNTGLKRKENWKDLKDSLTSIKSLYNYKKDIALYKKFTRTPWSYLFLLEKYSKFLGGFIKWKILGILTQSKKGQEK